MNTVYWFVYFLFKTFPVYSTRSKDYVMRVLYIIFDRLVVYVYNNNLNDYENK